MTTRFLPIATLALALLQPTRSMAAPGDLDPAFGVQGGFTTLRIAGAATRANAIASAADGGWYVGAVSFDSMLGRSAVAPPAGQWTLHLVKFRADGRVDTSFGIGGIALQPRHDAVEQAGAAALVVGAGRIYQLTAAPHVFGAARWLYVDAYGLDGMPDTSFGDGGRVAIDLGVVASLPAIGATMQNGRLLIAGTTRPTGAAFDSFLVVRLQTDGSFDPAFGASGHVVLAQNVGTGAANRLTDVRVLSSGRILVAGRTRAPNAALRGFVGRLLPNGAADASFGNAWFRTVAIRAGNTYGRNLVVQRDGRIVLGGTACDPANVETGDETCFAGLARLTADGMIDGSFGAAGIASFAAHPPGKDPSTFSYDAAIDRNGRLLSIGQGASLDPAQGTPQGNAFVLRAASNGNADATFGATGVARVDFGSTAAHYIATSIVSDLTARVVATGAFTGDDGVSTLMIARHVAE